MATVASPYVSEGSQARAIEALVEALGRDAVLTDGDDLASFGDPYSGAASTCAAAVLPSSVEEVQEVVRIATVHRVPLWTTSQGRNYGYGGAAARVPGSLALSLRRMNRVLEVDEDLAYAIVEPGVRFLDLYEHLRAGGYKLLVSTPDLGWGSVVGNALDHGIGYTPYGDHAATACGMEVVLADGDVVRTGLSAKSNAARWPVHPRGFGPTADALFMQSNFGIVTKMGLWLMPRPERLTLCTVFLKERPDLAPCVDALRPLVIDGTVGGMPTFGNPTAIAAGIGPRTEWYQGPGAMPPAAIEQMLEGLGLGYWTGRIPLYGRADVLEAQEAVLRRAMAQVTNLTLEVHSYAGDELAPELVPWPDQVPAGIPNNELLRILGWCSSEHGGHIGFSPIVPATGADALAAVSIAETVARRHALDVIAGVGICGRSALAVSALLFDVDDDGQRAAALRACEEMIRDAGAAGYGEYRAHTDFMDLVASQFDFNDHALRRFNERIKDALDPNGILSPGKQGIWPAAMSDGRSERGERDGSPGR